MIFFFHFFLLEPLDIIVGDFQILKPLSKIWEMIPPSKKREIKKGKKTSMAIKAKYIDSVTIGQLWWTLIHHWMDVVLFQLSNLYNFGYWPYSLLIVGPFIFITCFLHFWSPTFSFLVTNPFHFQSLALSFLVARPFIFNHH